MLKNRLLNTKLTEDQIAFFYLGQEGFLLLYQNTYTFFSYLFSWRKICILSLNFFIKKAQKMINHFLRLFIPQFHQ